MAPKIPAPLYNKGEHVFCFHGPMLYEAKIEEVGTKEERTKNNGMQQYRVHYKGWKATWDDIVDETRLKPINDDTIAERNTLQDEIIGSRSSKKKTKNNLPGNNKTRRSGANSDRDSEARSSNAPMRGTKRGREEIETEDAFTTRPSISIPTPEPIKSLLVDDWENITKNLQLVPLPHPRATVSDILREYQALEETTRVNPTDRQLLEEVIHGFEEYFNRSLGRVLLYRLERQQWLEVLEAMEKSPTDVDAHAHAHAKRTPAAKKTKKNNNKADLAESAIDPAAFAGKTPAQVYGSEHLCRLIVTLPELISQTNMDAVAVQRLREEVSGFTTWLSRERERFFVQSYENAGGDYLARVKGGY